MKRFIRPTIPDRVGLILILVAAILRILLWAQQRSLWIDEARVSLNVASRSYVQLLPPLDYDQAAPLLYLWVQRLVVDIFGVSEGSLRLVALVAGVGTVALTYQLARNWFGLRAAALATAVAALSPTLIYFSSEAKQYGVEACVSCAILYFGMLWLDDPSNYRRWHWLIALGVIALWLASPAMFVLAGLAIALLFRAGVQWRTRVVLTAHLVGWWGGSLALAYYLVYRNAAHDAYLRHYWSQAFLTPLRSGALLDAGVAMRAILWGPVSVLWGPTAMDSLGGPADLASVIFAPAVSVVIALLLFIGARRLVRAKGTGALLLASAPLVLVVLASGMQLYPISARTTMFYMPVVIILVAGGIEEMASRLRKPILAYALMAGACAPLAWIAAKELADPNPREHIRPLIDSLETNRRVGEPIYVFAGAIPAWAMYTTDWRSPDTRRLDYLGRIARAGGPAFENSPSRGRPVVREGDELTYSTPRGLELYGIPDGLEARVFGLTNALPDSGWAENEARRIGEVAHPTAWLILSHFYGPEGQLLGAIEAKGARPTYQDFRNGAVLLRYEFPASGAVGGE